jgi:pimeloyl-ACP methyl ester carboxylesterase
MPIARLSGQFRCIAYDLPNGYDDGARLGRYRHDDLVNDLWALLDHLQVSRCYLLGSSFGATIALRAMRGHPERVPRAILQGGVAQRSFRRAERFLAWIARRLPGRMAGLPKRERLLRAGNGFAFAHQPEEVWRYFVECTGQPRIAAVGHQARLLQEVDLRAELPAIGQPVLVVEGEYDRVVPAAYQKVLLEGLPNAGRAVIQGCGHIPSYTHPEVFAEVIRRFLTPAECATITGGEVPHGS